jgi:hypothetical protein
MRRTILLLASMALATLLGSGAALALPSETPDDTPMIDGRVRAIEQVGTHVWLGGQFSEVKQRDGQQLTSVSNVAVFDSKTNEYLPIAPKLGGTDSEVRAMTLYGDDVLIAGEFPGPSSKENNLVLVDGQTGEVIKWFAAPALKSVLAAPDLEMVYGGGESLSAFEFAPGKKRPLWTRAKTTVDKSLRDHNTGAGYHDLELNAAGNKIWAACACDAVDGKPAKALVKLNTDGKHDASWVAGFTTQDAFGHSVVVANGALYLGAGGSDFLAEVSKATGKSNWVRDTSGSVQDVTVMDDQLVIGGHFWKVSDELGDTCGAGQGSSDPTLDINNECKMRKGIAAYSFEGALDPEWAPVYAGSYSLVWTLHVEGTRLHTGGQFKKVSKVVQTSYARLSQQGASPQ